MKDFDTFLGIVRNDDGSVVLNTRPDHISRFGTIHFAVLTTLAEVAAAQEVQASVIPAAISVQFLVPAQPGKLIATGRLLRRGRRLAVAEGEVRREGKLIAKATVTFALL